jgi:hypothetical protein
MKRTLLFIAFVLTSLTISAHESYTDDFDYLPFVEEGKRWYVARFTPGHDDMDEIEYYIPVAPFAVEKISGINYYKMKAIINNSTEIETYLIREEDRKVYLFDTDTQKEYLMFDYSLKAGDTYETYSYEYHKMVKYEVLSVSDYEEGPEVFSYVYDEETKNITKHRRYLRKWVVASDIEERLCLEPKTWIEGVGSLEGPFASLYDTSYSLDHLAYVLYNGDPYLPFTFHESIGKLWFGCNMPTGEENYHSEDKHHHLTYELEGNSLHVFGKVLTHGGANTYAYFLEEPTDDSSVRKFLFKIQEIEPLPDPRPGSDGLRLLATDFYVENFNPAFDYIIVDNQGEEHPVINKTQQMAYRPMIEDGKVWKVGYGSNNPIQFVEYYYFDGDTIINGKTCKQMMRQRYVTPDYPDYDAVIQIPLLQYVGAWYEENKKVFFYNAKENKMLMYDFSLDTDDTFMINEYGPYMLGPKQTGGLKGFKGVYRDVMMLWDEEQNTYNTTWLEGVGSIEGPSFNVYYGKEYHGGAVLMSCTVDDEVIYLNDEYEDGASPWEMDAKKHRFDFTHTIKTKPQTRSEAAEEKQSLYGEYNDQQLGINLDPLDEAYLVRITNESDKVVYEKTINAGNIVALNIDISAYPEGRYTVTIENNGESFTGEFVTQTTGIEENVKTEIIKNTSIYNLQGQQLNTLQRGLNIVNGRKVLVK